VPLSNAPIDVVSLYKDLYGQERAKQQWQKAFDYYSQLVAYLSRFQGDKAQGPRSDLQYNLRIMVLLRDIAEDTLQDQEAVKQVEAVLMPFRTLMYE